MSDEEGLEEGIIRNVATLDLTTVSSAEELSRIKGIRNVAVIYVPESLAGALAAIPQRNVANVVPVPNGARINSRVGVVTMDGAALAAKTEVPTVLALTGALVITSPVERVGYHSIIVVGVVVAPEGSQAVLSVALRQVVGTVNYYPWAEGQSVRVFQGDRRARGEVLANPGGRPNDIALVAGTLVVTSPVPSVGFQQVVVVGALIAPEASEDLLSPVLHLVGDAVWYSAPPRLFTGTDRFGAAFFELLDGPVTLVLNGTFELEPDVPREIVRERVAAIALNGVLKAAPAMVPLLQVLTIQKNGVLEALDEAR